MVRAYFFFGVALAVKLETELLCTIFQPHVDEDESDTDGNIYSESDSDSDGDGHGPAPDVPADAPGEADAADVPGLLLEAPPHPGEASAGPNL